MKPIDFRGFLVETSEIRKRLRNEKPFYVYILHKPDGVPFYVGKGVRDRVLNHEAEARNTKKLTHKLNVIRSLHRKSKRVLYKLDSFYENEIEACQRERHLISLIGRHDLKKGPLTNQTDGGEGTSNPSEESRQRRRDSLWGNAEDPERQVANRFFQQLTPVRSVPIKPVKTFNRADGLWKNDDTIGMKPRQAAAIVASAIQNRIMLQSGALIPRRLIVDGVEYIMENGVGRDMVSNGMITIAENTRTYEILRLTKNGFNYILSAFEKSMLVDAGILMPDQE